MNTEQMIISNILFYKDARHFLPQINKNWFKDALCQKIVGVITDMYYNNEEIDYLTLVPHFTKKELIEVISLQQNASGIMNVKPHLKKLEYAFIKSRLIESIMAIDIQKELGELIEDIQGALNNTTFSTHQEPESIVKVTNKVVDQIIANSEKGGKLVGKETGWKFLDKYLGGYNEGDLIVMAGRPGMGKTAIALTLTKEFAERGGKALFISLEMSSEQLAKRYVSLLGELANWKMRNGILTAYEIEKIIEVANSQTIEFFVDDDRDGKLEQIKSKARLHKARVGLDLLVIDYLQLMTGTKQNREQEVAEISRGLKLLAKELKCTIMVLAQLSRKPEDRSDKRPLLSDLRESGAIEQDADVVMFPFRPDYYKDEKPEIEDAELIIAKNRNGECATIPTTYQGQYTMYKENIAPKVANPFEF
jgi:replicative DNA helicase